MADPRGHRLRLGELLAEDAFRLELLSGGAGAASRDVAGAHAVEVSSPARWLGPGWIMLTTGVRTPIGVKIYGNDLEYRFEILVISVNWVALVGIGGLMSLFFRRAAGAGGADAA